MNNVGPDKLWPNGKPCIIANNFFTHEKLLKWLGENGYGYLGTAARNKLFKAIPKKYFHSLDSKNISLFVLFFVACCKLTHPFFSLKFQYHNFYSQSKEKRKGGTIHQSDCHRESCQER